MKKKKKTLRIALLALFTAIIILQNFIPFLGYIPLGVLNLTIIHVTVIIAALLLGPKDGAIVGGIWGTITFIRAFVWPTSPIAPIVFVNPLISILPRILIGVVAGYAFIWAKKSFHSKIFAASLASVLGSLTNTFLVLGQIYLFYRGQSQVMYGLDTAALMPYLLGLVLTNGIPEALIAAIVSPAVALPLAKRIK
ncbi:ECF transporter S component [Ligilactobacillus faecis]|uniref:ECF transporter S component n=1 Tax=Ligilactobacillus faecis TaxID=762833 RepID=UPI0024688A97|nr:ECF transporter S component [Ligilactobacillus faecis]WGN88786.1 ECF transporter S component [Ligilactobacillus faecis]